MAMTSSVAWVRVRMRVRARVRVRVRIRVRVRVKVGVGVRAIMPTFCATKPADSSSSRVRSRVTSTLSPTRWLYLPP